MKTNYRMQASYLEYIKTSIQDFENKYGEKPVAILLPEDEFILFKLELSEQRMCYSVNWAFDRIKFLDVVIVPDANIKKPRII